MHLPLPTSHALRAGFSLVELSVVIVIISIVALMGLEVAATYMGRTAYQTTQERMQRIDAAIVKYVKVKDRLPCPGGRLDTWQSTNYGKELRSGNLCNAGPMNNGTNPEIQYGDVPARDLNLPLSVMVDGFGSKFRYVVTRSMGRTSAELDTGAANENFFDSANGITIRSGGLDTTCDTAGTLCQTRGTAAYVIFSHGKDRRGAHNKNGILLGGCSPDTTTDGKIDSVNCRLNTTHSTITLVKNGSGATVTVPANVFYDSRYNTGTQEQHFFDDLILWRSRSDL